MTNPGPPQPPLPRAGASAVLFRDGAVLLVKRDKPETRGLWSLPGGHIEPGERARDAALREVAEETGLGANLHGLADVHDVIVRDSDGSLVRHYVLAVFYGEAHAGTPRAGGDAADARFVTLSELASLPLTEGAEPLIRRVAALITGNA